jgi:hypothetical protein
MPKMINHPYGIWAFMMLASLMSCEPIQDQERAKLKEGLEVAHKSLFEDENGYAHYAFFVKNNNDQTIKSAKISLLLLGFKNGMHPNEAYIENLAPGDSVQLSVNLFVDYDQKQDYHFSSEVEEIAY